VEKVSSTLYSNRQDPVGLVSDAERQGHVNLLASDFADLEEELSGDWSAVTMIYLRAAHLHLHLSAFFSSPSLPSYRTDLLRLYNATTAYLETCLGLKEVSSPSLLGPGGLTGMAGAASLIYGTNYIFQMLLVAGFALLKLHNSFLPQVGLNEEKSKRLVNNTTWALRSMSVQENDLAQRLAEVLAQLVWKGSRAASEKAGPDAPLPASIDESMRLRVRCRMSVSLVYDSVWRWREEAHRRGISLECKTISATARQKRFH
jgi:hypothetical protein